MTTDRTDFPDSLDERSTLLTMLDYTRKTAIAKCEGLSDELARKAPLPASPLTTISGLISHMRWVEWSWIQRGLLGVKDDGPWTDEDDPDREFHYRLDWPLADIIADYQALAREHDAQLAGLDLEMKAVRRTRSGADINLRWILHHLVEENARHNGHIDILRELADGVTGS
jgi:uncharacterized damage-inducible protein DinB